jgi:hypothetical protein
MYLKFAIKRLHLDFTFPDEMTSLPTSIDSQEMVETWVLSWTKVGNLRLDLSGRKWS